MAQLFERSRKEGRVWRARCPVHKSKGLTLAVYADADRCSVYCHAGCASDDILKAVGLTWKDCLYRQRSTKEIREAKEARRKQEAFEYRGRIRNLITLFANEGYATQERDWDVSVATAAIMSVEGARPALQAILDAHMERLIAAGILRDRPKR